MKPGLAQAIARELALEADGTAPRWIQLLPAGELQARDGRRWRHDNPEEVLAASRERTGPVDLVVDYEHQTELAAENGQPAPAAGWIQELEVRGGELWGRVEWTERARAAIDAKEYRYISPSFAFDAKSRTVKALHRAALTNSPALDMPALARDQGDAMTPEQLAALAAALGLAKTATPDEVVAKAKTAVADALAPVAEALGLAKDATSDELVARAKTIAADALAPVAEAMGLAKTATADELVAKAKASPGAPNPGEFVPRAEFDRVARDLTTLQSERAEERATAAVDEAIASGKVAPAQREWALGYAKSDAAGFDTYVENAPVILAPARVGDPPRDRDPNAELTSDELAMCSALGIAPEQFKKSREALSKRQGGDQ